MKFLTFIFVPLLAAANATASYQEEIGAVRARGAVYREESEQHLQVLQGYELVLREAQWRGQEIGSAVSLHGQRKGQSMEQSLALEYVYTEGVLDKLNEHEPHIRYALKRADQIAKALPGAEVLHTGLKMNTEATLSRLRKDFEFRRSNLEAAQRDMFEARRHQVLQSIAEKRLATLSELEFREKLHQAGSAFRKVRRTFLHKQMELRKDEAENLLVGFRWLKSILPGYFSAATGSQVEYARRLQEEINEMEADMAGRLQKWTHPPVELPRRAGVSGSVLVYAGGLRVAGIAEKKRKEEEQKKDSQDVTLNWPPLSDRPGNRGEKSDSGKIERPAHIFEPNTFNDGMIFADSGIPVDGIIRKKGNEAVRMPRGNVIREERREATLRALRVPPSRAKREARDHQGKPIESRPDDYLLENTRELHGLLDRIENDAGEASEQRSVQELRAEVASFAALQHHFEREVGQCATKINGSLRETDATWKSLQIASAPALPKSILEPSPWDNGLPRMAAETGAGFIPGYDFVNFLHVAATGQTLFGESVSENEKLFLGVSAVLSVIPGGTIVSTTLKNIRRLEKVAPKLARGIGAALKTRNLPLDLAHLNPSLVIAGKGEKVAVIGRQMKEKDGLKGVIAFTEHLKSTKGIDARFFAPSKDAVADWNKAIEINIARGGNGWLKPHEVKQTLTFKENFEWIQKLKNEGYSVIDIGFKKDLNDTSVFYEMELIELGLKRGHHVY